MTAVEASKELVGTVDRIAYDDLPDPVVGKAKKLTLDTLGCSVAAYDAGPCGIVREYAESSGGDAATVIGDGGRATMEKAALANCTLARYLDLNDTGRSWNGEGGHPSGNILAALAVAEGEGAGGRELIEAVVAGYEVQLMMYDFPAVSTFREVGWDHTSAAHYSTAMVAGKLLGLSRAELLDALGIAGSYVVLGQLRVGDISAMKAPAFGLAAERGIEAALLARGGLTGPGDVIEGERGYMEMLAGGGDPSVLSGPPEYRIERACIKQYPTAYVTHAPIQATLELVRGNDIDPDDIEHIDVHTFGWLIEDMVEGMGGTPRTAPETKETADHSLPYVVAVAAIDREVGIDQFAPGRITADDVRSTMERIGFHRDAELEERYPEARPARVEITADGETYERELDYPSGDPRDPLDADAVEAKFRSLADPHLSGDRRDAVIDIVSDLESVSDFTRLMEHLETG